MTNWIVAILSFFLIIILFVLYTLSLNPTTMDSHVIWGKNEHRANIYGKDYSVWFQVHGYSLNPPKYKWSEPSSKWDWRFAVVLIRHIKNRNDLFLYTPIGISSDAFFTGKSNYIIDQSRDKKVIFYSDVEGNIRQLVIHNTDPMFIDTTFDYLKESYTPINTIDPALNPIESARILDLWVQLQSYNHISTIFWKNPYELVDPDSPDPNPPESDPISGENPEAEQVDAKKPIDEPI